MILLVSFNDRVNSFYHPDVYNLQLQHFVYVLCSGSAVSFKMRCNSNHSESLSNSDNIGTGRKSTPKLNLMLMVFIFLSGLQFDRLKV